jgi:hypothetical protein
LDVSEYLIKYSPLTTGADWFGCSELIRTSALYANLNIAQTGTYMIKAIDTTGHESVAADEVVTSTVASQVGLTPHTLIVEEPAWAGSLMNHFVKSGSILKLQWTGGEPAPGTVISEINAQYPVSALIDFGSSKTARVSAKCVWSVAAVLFDDITGIDECAGWDGGTSKSNVQLYIVTSLDGSAPSFKQPLFAGDYTFQRAEFILEAFEQLPDLITVSSLNINVDLHDTVLTI